MHDSFSFYSNVFEYPPNAPMLKRSLIRPLASETAPAATDGSEFKAGMSIYNRPAFGGRYE